MQRSAINSLIHEAEEFFAHHHFMLPPFAGWDVEQWQRMSGQIDEILDCELGWDITDFGRDQFFREGLLLFTIRNGKQGDARYTKAYAEKIMIVREEQVTLRHCHGQKTEDIIVRGGGKLVFELYNRAQDGSLDTSPVVLRQDGVTVTIPAGGHICLSPGESITLTPGVYHKFWGEHGCGQVLVGEVSSVNDDHTDNLFYAPQQRFPSIDEDVPPSRLMVGDYAALMSGLRGK